MTIHSIKCMMLAGVFAIGLMFATVSAGVAAGDTPAPATKEQAKPGMMQQGLAQPGMEKAKPGSMQPGDAKSPEEWVEARITKLQADLKIAPAQEAAWKTIAAEMRDNAKIMRELIEKWAGKGDKLTALESLKIHAEMAEQHAKGQRGLLPDFEKLYTAMTPEQKANADIVFARHEGRTHEAKK